jgi:hypothetical protein
MVAHGQRFDVDVPFDEHQLLVIPNAMDDATCTGKSLSDARPGCL